MTVIIELCILLDVLHHYFLPNQLLISGYSSVVPGSVSNCQRWYYSLYIVLGGMMYVKSISELAPYILRNFLHQS